MTLLRRPHYNEVMSIPILSTKLFIPPPRTNAVRRDRLIERLNEGLAQRRKLTLVTAPAGYGKTTLIADWLAERDGPVAWLSLDEGDRDIARFLIYLVSALRKIDGTIGESALGVLRTTSLPPVEEAIASLINELAAVRTDAVLVLDDCHVLVSEPAERALNFLLDHIPPNIHMVVVSREAPRSSVARLRARGQLTELKANDLRFTLPEAADFLHRVMNLRLAPEEAAELEARTEGWIAGLQLAALSMQGIRDVGAFIRTFSGRHRDVLDYLLEEVLRRQSAEVQTFLLRTSILDRLCARLCEAVLGDEASDSGQRTLVSLENANLFLVPLDEERRWYRYHHLFAELLRDKLSESEDPAGLHVRASEWYERNGLELEAFRHAAAAGDVDRAARLMEGGGMPLLFRGAVFPVIGWLESLPPSVVSAKPSLSVAHASALLMIGQMHRVEAKLLAAEADLADAPDNEETRDLHGHIASIRASVAVSRHRADDILFQSKRALAFLRPDNLPVRTATTWSLGYAYDLRGDRAGAGRCYREAQKISLDIGHAIISVMSTIGMASLLEKDNRLDEAQEAYRFALELAKDTPFPATCEAYLGLARIGYERNDLDAAGRHAETSLRLARDLKHTDRYAACEIALARVQLAGGDPEGAAERLAKVAGMAEERSDLNRLPELAEAQAVTLLRRGLIDEAALLANSNELPFAKIRVLLARNEAAAAVALLEPLLAEAEKYAREDERLKIRVLLAISLHLSGDAIKSVQIVEEALALAESGGFVRLFVDEGMPMARLLAGAVARGSRKAYAAKLLAAFGESAGPAPNNANARTLREKGGLIEPLSDRETEVLKLIAEGKSNREIGELLYLALSSVKGHNQNIFGKLQVKRRTEAVARARELGLI